MYTFVDLRTYVCGRGPCTFGMGVGRVDGYIFSFKTLNLMSKVEESPWNNIMTYSTVCQTIATNFKC